MCRCLPRPFRLDGSKSWLDMIRFVRCIDNTLATDVLIVGKVYEVLHVNNRDGYYALCGLGQFAMARFQPVSAAEAGYG